MQNEGVYESLPLWRLYAWRLNQFDTPPNGPSKNESEGILDGILDGISASVPVGPLVVSANLGKIADEVADEGDYVSKVATDVFADQMESDYPIDGKVDVREGFREPELIDCSNDEDNYSNSPADVHVKYSFKMEYDVGEGGSTRT